MPTTADSSDVIALESRIRTLRDALLAAQLDRTADIAAAHPAHRRSAANLVHYVELRNHDIRELQTNLGLMGLSSLGRSEPYVLATIEAVLSVLAAMSDRDAPESLAEITLTEGHDLLDASHCSPCHRVSLGSPVEMNGPGRGAVGTGNTVRTPERNTTRVATPVAVSLHAMPHPRRRPA